MERSNLSFCGRTRPSLDANIPELAVLHASVNAVLENHHANERSKVNSARGVAEAIKVATCALPAAVTKRGSVATAPATTSTAAATATAPATTTAAATSSAATVADHLSKTGVDLLLGLPEHVDEVTSLLGI
jgi:uncharacterized protein involved in propanediol utilization